MFGYQPVSHIQLEIIADFTLNILEFTDKIKFPTEIDSVVFSKDRAMQLHAFLLSYIERVNNRGMMFILYKCSNKRHKRSYDELRSTFIEEEFVFIEEQDFRQQLIEILEKSVARKIFFYVDDMIFTHRIDYKKFEIINTREYILTLSRGKDMDYSIVLQKPLVPPPFTKFSDNLERFNWNYSDIYSDWTYPLGLSGYMYGKIEITAIVKTIPFKAPNSLESGMQSFLILFKNRFGLCTEFASCICIPANLVQTECKNPTLGSFSIEELLVLWEAGKRIDVGEFYEKEINIAEVQKYTFI